MSRVQVVRPAGAGHETLYVLLVSLLILAVAGGIVALRGEDPDEVRIEAHQLDARRDLNAAEQGVYADLRVAFEEIQLRREEDPAPVEVTALAAEGFPPFTRDASSASRGEHQWQRLGEQAYLGLSQAPGVAGSFLLLLPGSHDGVADVWLQRKADASVPAELTRDALIAAGWQQIAVQYDAGVTRQHRH